MARPHASRPSSHLAEARPGLALSLLACAVAGVLSGAALAQDGDDGAATQDAPATELDTVRVTAEAIARQALGTSIITAEDIERRPPANDLSELLRTMPGVNLTGNSSSGQYGNNRQIDLRGMGPENTLILVDGRPVGSRDSIRMGRSGERNTRGDTNWVPAEAVERIEVLHGPAAARYGSGASGGVVNIITKRPTGELSGSLSLFGLVPMHGEEGGSERVGVQLGGPLGDALSFRVFANSNRTQADSLDLNADFAANPNATPPAGREGVQNKDFNGLLRWDLNDDHVLEFEGGFSRQGNIYAGDRAVSGSGSGLLTELANAGAETNRLYRTTGAVTHRGTWGDNSSRLSLSYEATNNKRLNEGLAGGAEGSISTATGWSTSRLRNTSLDGEVNIPVAAGAEHVLTLGFEHRDSRLEDPYSVQGAINWGGNLPGVDPSSQDGKADAQLTAVFVEDNIYLGERWILTPGLRYDHHSQFGGNASPSLNAQYQLGNHFTLKGGVARAFKAPNLYQSNPNYLYYTMGNGCPLNFPSVGGSGCYVVGNAGLAPETSINKEIGIEWAPDTGYHASLTWFHNDYKDKIAAGFVPVGETVSGARRVFQWENMPKAIVEGLEGNVIVPLAGERGSVLKWNTNLTYMLDNTDQETGQPLSIVPEYTVNTTLDWQATDSLSLLLTGTFYGEQEPPRLNINNDDRCSTATDPDLCMSTRSPYNLWSISARYRITDKISVGGGVNNLFDKRLFRENNSNGAGAATYNEPGRAYFVSMNVGF